MTTNQGNESALFNDGASVEDDALTDHENEEVLDSPIDLNNLVNLCEGTEMCRVITKRQVKGKQVMLACGHLAAGCPRLNHEDQQQNDPSSQAAALWYEALPTPRKNVIDGRLDGTVLTAEAYEEARARAEADLLDLAASLYPERDEDATDGETTGNSEGGGREREHGARCCLAGEPI
jgi:hypothetical protein